MLFDNEDISTFYHGDCIDLMRSMPDRSVMLVVTSPPYNINKSYETQVPLEEYLNQQEDILHQARRILHPNGSLCWQVGNYVNKGEIIPLDIPIFRICHEELGMKLRNRVVWHFEHGLHCKKRLSGRYETIMWFTKTDDYIFNLDPIRVPQKYPNKKNYKGKNKGKLSCNPLGKNPGDVWVIPNVKHNHCEKTGHPCQFPIELVERLILSLTNEGDVVFDPYAGVASSLCAAIIHNRKACGSELMESYYEIGMERIKKAESGTLPFRKMNTPVYQPD